MKKEYGIIGCPLGQSASPAFFNNKFANEGIDAEYIPFEIENIEKLPEILENHPLLCGFNVTIPYKLQVMDYLEEISDEAKGIMAVNVVKITRDSNGRPHLKGYNSDVIGFTRSLEPLTKGRHNKALILGTGGVSKAVSYSLNTLGIEHIFVSRKASENAIAYEQLTDEIMNTHTLIINCTPLGMVGHGVDKCPDIPYNKLTNRHLLYDVVYNPENTLFLQKGAAQGAQTKSGYEMWYLQALASWEIWNKKDTQ
ncbi:MAG: shikimate dehydrogenase [Bacteroidaceae bacterium]|nr:shikimate dehydrogenase [Bacteroidaceae bacterium]MBQ8270770.1 shikimate dehydrogenase [Bacteroidaceae bacterium]